MNYTQSDAHVTHAGTGRRMHQDTAPVTTAVSASDLNSVRWELMQLIEQAGLVPQEFDADVPATYTQVKAAIVALTDLAVASRGLTYSVRQYGCICDGVTDDTDAFQNAINTVPEGAQLRIRGLLRIREPITITRRVSIWCDGADDAVLVDLTDGTPMSIEKDALTFVGGATGLNGLNMQLNIYGKPWCCRNAVVLDRVDRFSISITTRVGAANYAVVMRGMLIGRMAVDSSANYSPPIPNPGMPIDHILIEKNVTHNVATNAVELWVNLEGARHGIVMKPQPGNEGQNWIHGCIEGLTGRPMDVEDNANVRVSDMWMEANAMSPRFVSCMSPELSANVFMFNAPGGQKTWQFIDCQGPRVNGLVFGYATFDGTTYGGRLNGYGAEDITVMSSHVVNAQKGDGMEMGGPIVDINGGSVCSGGFGRSTLENIFLNPWMDIWPAGGAAAPAGTTLVNATVARNGADFYPGAGAFCAQVTITAAGSANNGLHIIPAAPHSARPYGRWISFAIPVLVLAGQPDVWVYGCGGALVGKVTTKNEWVIVRGGSFLSANAAIDIWCTCHNGSGFSTGVFKVGGASIVEGMLAPKQLCDSGRRSEYIVPRVDFEPAFIGQRAFVGGTGKWYMARGVSSAADWVILN